MGCGKSSLLMAILGEIPTSEGHIEIHGKLSFLDQEPWGMTSRSLRENITFGSKFDPEWYEEVVTACALTEVFSSLPEADETLVRNVTLSGGQRCFTFTVNSFFHISTFLKNAMNTLKL